MNKLPLQVGVTGGLGAGKSLVCEIFSTLGIPVYNADLRARWLMENKKELIEDIQSAFGEKSYRDGNLSRDYLAKRVFNDPEELQKLNSMVHPRVREDGMEWAQAYTGKPYVVREAALMIESGSYKDLDVLVVVTAPENVRKERVLKRDSFRTAEEVDRILLSQIPEEEKIKLADHVVNNDGSQLLIPQVLEIHKKYGG